MTDAWDMTVDVVVVGGGPAGSATALWSAQHGLRVVVVERERFPRQVPGRRCRRQLRCFSVNSEWRAPSPSQDSRGALGHGWSGRVHAASTRLEPMAMARCSGFRRHASDSTASCLSRRPTPDGRPGCRGGRVMIWRHWHRKHRPSLRTRPSQIRRAGLRGRPERRGGLYRHRDRRRDPDRG